MIFSRAKNILIVGILCVASFLAFSFSAHAQSADLRLITSPLPINLVADPGTTVTADLKVKNDGTQEEKLKIDVMKFSAYGETGSPRLMDPEPVDDFVHWVSFSDPTFSIGPGEWKTVKATFDVPKTAAFGYYYAIVFSRADDEQVTGSNATALVGGTAILVLLDANVPDAKRQVAVKQFSADKSFYEFLPTTFDVKLENIGNVHVAPHGNIFISHGNGQPVATLDVNAEQGNILPDSGRIFTSSWDDGFPVYAEKIEDGKVVHDKDGNVVRELKWNWNDASKLRFGKYVAKLVLVYDDGQRDVPIEAEVSFWVMPWRLIGGGAIILIFVLIGFKTTVQSWYRRIRSVFA